MSKEKAITEIKRLADAHFIPIIYFVSHDDMRELLEDMRFGNTIRTGLKQMNITTEKELLM